MEFIRVGGVAEIPDGEMRAFDTPAGRVAVAHVEHRLFAFGDECTHQGCSLAEGEFDDREARVVCPCHGSVFDVETGRARRRAGGGPGAGLCRPPDGGWLGRGGHAGRR